MLVKAILNTHKPFIKANRIIHQHFQIRHKVLPIALANSKIQAGLANGKTLIGQRSIADYLSFSRAPIQSISLTKKALLLPEAERAMVTADFLVFAPGHFFTSLLPHLSVTGFASAWKRSRAKKLWFLNLLAHKGQDSYYTLIDYLGWFQKVLGLKPFDEIWYNAKISKLLLKQVEDRFEEMNIPAEDLDRIKNLGIMSVKADLVATGLQAQVENDFIQRAPIRHDTQKIKQTFKQILNV